MTIYETAVRALQKDGLISHADSVLVLCGGDYDKASLAALGFSDVTVSNLDLRYGKLCAPFKWAYLDAEDINVPNGSFDWAVVHMGLHHCASPHRGLTEMMRVARKGVLVMENRESALMRAAVALGLTPDYEIESVVLHPALKGGVRDTGVPNFIYRWTEREVFKAVESARPGEVNDLRFFYGLRLPTQRFAMYPRAVQSLVGFLGILARGLFKLSPRQGNEFGFAIIRTGKLKPWVREADGELEFNTDYRLGYDTSKYELRSWDESA